MIYCQKLKKEAQGLERAPMPGELGQKILENISLEAWQAWVERQTMLINEHQLNLIDPKARSFLKDELNKFLFEGIDAPPSGYVPPSKSKT